CSQDILLVSFCIIGNILFCLYYSKDFRQALRQYLTFFITHIKQHPEIGTLAYEEIINESSQLEKIKPYII
ncbi:hypothetical protein ABE52_00015, partial [Bacillus thuringiensis]|nr:hypothetical protein [Bacillus thuringiensis]